MQVPLHDLAQETATGNSYDYIEPDLQVRSLIVNVTAISVNLLGSITFKVQHSPDGANWTDVPNLSTAGLTSTGFVTVSVSPVFSCMNHLRVAWTFNNANSVTFVATVTGE